jgi:aminoglycoside phosphotransferase (APT) family kinase protein
VELLARGRDCEVFLLDDGRVARAYTDGRSARAEAELIQQLHALGYPVPEVFGWDGPRIVMERVVGPTLGERLFAGEVTVEEAATTQADLQARLHALPWPGGQPLLHLDLHPLNVLVGPDGPVVIDWTNAEPGPPGLDLALSAVILAGVALTGEVPEARDLLAAYVAVAPAPYVDHLDAAAALRLSKPHTTADERRLMAQTVELARNP